MRLGCDVKLTNALVLTMDDAMTVHRSGEVCVAGDRIVAVGAHGSTAGYDAARTIDCGGRVVMPGLINAHTHAPMSLMRGLADDLRLDVWLLGYMMPVEREFVSPDFVALGTKLSCAEMIRGGVTCFADMYYFEESVARASADAGLRALCGQTVLKFPSPDAPSYDDSLAAARDFILRWRHHPLITPAVAPHAPYTCTSEILLASAGLAAEFDVPLHIHLSETALEVDEHRRTHGMPVVPWVKKHRLFEAKVLAAHCVHVDEGEIRTLVQARAGIAHNPSSNLKLAAGIAPVARMLALGAAVGIGTDGAASNNNLDMFEEMRLAALLAKGAGDPTVLPAKQALLMATRMGARALHLDDVTGCLEPGRRADLIIVDLTAVHNTPRFERDDDAVYAQIVYAAKSTDVVSVMCNGRWLMEDRRLLTLDETELTRAAADYARRIDRFLATREESVLQKLVAIGGAVEQESYEVQVKARVASAEAALAVLASDALTIVRRAHYHEYDTYFFFADPAQGRLRYREDEFLDDDEHGRQRPARVRARLTLTGPTREARFGSVVLSRSRYLAPATQSLRFYREYFRPVAEKTVEKDRRRWLVAYRGVEFFVNLDRLLDPEDDAAYVEVKSRTWSRRDASDRAAAITELLALFGASPDAIVHEDYVDMRRP